MDFLDLLDMSQEIKTKIPLEDEFWAVSSNLQVWSENEDSTHLLYRNIAFPLLSFTPS